MIEPHSAQDGASAWVAKATLTPPPSEPPSAPVTDSSVRLPFPLPFVDEEPFDAPLDATVTRSH